MNEMEVENKKIPSQFSDISEILRTLRKRKRVIIWSTIICGVIALFTSLFIISPKYNSSTDILVNRKADGNQIANAQAQIQADVQMISTYKDIITSPTVLNSVSHQLNDKGYQVTADQLKGEISISNQQNSQVFTLAVKADNPNLAADAANTIAKVFKKNVIKIMSINNVTILSKAVPNQKPVSPKILLNTLVGILLGLILGLVLAFVFSALDRTVTDESFITDELGLNDLGIINEIPSSKVKRMIEHKHSTHISRKRRV